MCLSVLLVLGLPELESQLLSGTGSAMGSCGKREPCHWKPRCRTLPPCSDASRCVGSRQAHYLLETKVSGANKLAIRITSSELAISRFKA